MSVDRDEMIGVQKDLAQLGTIVDRFDAAIQKLTEVSSAVSQLLAVQANRLEFQEKVTDKLSDLMDKRKHETDSTFKDVYQKISDVQESLKEEMEDNNKNILDELKNLRVDSQAQHKEISDRMSKIEKWMLMIVGGSIVVTFILSNVNFSKLF